MSDGLKKRSVIVDGHRTSVSLEGAFWNALRDIAKRRTVTLNQLISDIDKGRAGNLSSAIRVYILGDLQDALAIAMNAVAPAGE